MSPGGHALRRVRKLHRRRVLQDADMAVLKDAIVDGKDITVWLAWVGCGVAGAVVVLVLHCLLT